MFQVNFAKKENFWSKFENFKTLFDISKQAKSAYVWSFVEIG